MFDILYVNLRNTPCVSCSDISLLNFSTSLYGTVRLYALHSMDIVGLVQCSMCISQLCASFDLLDTLYPSLLLNLEYNSASTRSSAALPIVELVTGVCADVSS